MDQYSREFIAEKALANPLLRDVTAQALGEGDIACPTT